MLGKSNVLALFVSILFSQSLYSQKEGSIWYFGIHAGIDFSSGSPVALTDGALVASEGCATICDTNGHLLFYTQGIQVFNKNHEPMLNSGMLSGGSSSAQASLIVKKPGFNSLFYLFTTDHEAGIHGFRYSVVDMTLDDGLGGITSERDIPIANPTCEKLIAVRHHNQKDYWIITHLFNSDVFQAYLLSSSGLDMTPVESKIGAWVNNSNGYGSAAGNLKANKTGTKIVSTNQDYWIAKAEVFDFNNETGILSNNFFTRSSAPYKPYGVEFSPNGRFLYFHYWWMLLSGNGKSWIDQYDLLAGSPEDIMLSKSTLDTIYYQGVDGGLAALQLGPDNRIYCARKDKDSLAIISYPNNKGDSCGFVLNGFYLGGKQSSWGLPNFSNAIFEKPNLGEEPYKPVLELPNVFTPNNDGVNDIFRTINLNSIVTMTTQIYNRWGQLIFETNNPNIEWDGSDQSEGTYFWIVSYQDFYHNHYTKNGTVTLLR